MNSRGLGDMPSITWTLGFRKLEATVIAYVGLTKVTSFFSPHHDHLLITLVFMFIALCVRTVCYLNDNALAWTLGFRFSEKNGLRGGMS